MRTAARAEAARGMEWEEWKAERKSESKRKQSTTCNNARQGNGLIYVQVEGRAAQAVGGLRSSSELWKMLDGVFHL